MNRRSIMARLEELEKKCGSTLPVVNAEYRNGERVTYYGLPPIEHLFREENPIIRTSGSEFAGLVDALLHPLPNRNISDFEGVKYEEGENKGSTNCGASGEYDNSCHV